MSSMTEPTQHVIPTVDPGLYLGVDTHKDTHHAALLDHDGRPVADREFPATTTGYTELIDWAHAAGIVRTAGVEGTGTYGAGLTRVLRTTGICVVEVDQPDRRTRRRRGKTDQIDAYSAADAARTGRATTIPKTHDGDVEALRFLHLTRASSVKSRAEAVTQLKSLLVTAPEPLRGALRTLTTPRLVAAAAALPISTGDDPVSACAQLALRSLAHRITALTDEITALEAQRDPIVERLVPSLLAEKGIGYETASELAITFGDNADRITSEAAFAHLCGAAPIAASSGKTTRMRLNHGGNRQANRALHVIIVSRFAHHEETRAYRERRTAEGKSTREIMRCLKRFLARRIYNLLIADFGLDKS